MEDNIYLPRELVGRDAPERLLHMTANALAWLGTLLFIGLVGMSIVSITGRKLGFLSITGDLEILQMGAAVASACFFPLCTLRGDHLRVDFFTEGIQKSKKVRLDAFADLLLATVMALLAWRTWDQVKETLGSGETSALLSIPMWIPVSMLIPALVTTMACAFYRAYSELFKLQEDQ